MECTVTPIFFAVGILLGAGAFALINQFVNGSDS